MLTGDAAATQQTRKRAQATGDATATTKKKRATAKKKNQGDQNGPVAVPGQQTEKGNEDVPLLAKQSQMDTSTTVNHQEQ